MRKTFFTQLHASMAADPRIVLLVGDLGFRLTDAIQRDFPDRYHNMGVAEFTMTGAAIGMTYSGLIPIIYSITPFVILRNMELLRTYVNHERAPIKIVGAGRGRDYKHEGISHHAHDIKAFLDCMPNIVQWWPEDDAGVASGMHDFLYSNEPTFLSLRK